MRKDINTENHINTETNITSETNINDHSGRSHILNRVTSFGFVGVLFLIFLLNLITPDVTLSKAERRKLNLFPQLSIASITSSDYADAFEKFALDQMVFRESFRNVKARVAFDVFQMSDNNAVFIREGHAFKMVYPYDDAQVKQMAQKIQKVYDLYLKEMNVFYAIIPDKNYTIQGFDEHLTLDYEQMMETLAAHLTDMKGIPLFDVMTLEAYYQSDLHWRQDALGPVIDVIGDAMGFETSFDIGAYDAVEMAPFYGAYYGEANARVAADVLTYLTSEWLEKTVVTHIEEGKQITGKPVYDVSRFDGMDGYDVFLSGPSPIVTLENPLNSSGKSLILFRDSFGSSIAPLLMAEYAKVTLVDLRYVTTAQIGDFVDFSDKNQDVLFLYNAVIVNNSSMIR